MDNCLHTLIVENQKLIKGSGVKEVLAFSDREIRLKLTSGGNLKINGEGLKITAFDDKTGNFVAVGKVFGAQYKNNEHLLKKVFK